MTSMSRREFGRASAALSLSALLPERLYGDAASSATRVTVYADSEPLAQGLKPRSI